MFSGDLGNIVRTKSLLRIIGFLLLRTYKERESKCVRAHSNTHGYVSNMHVSVETVSWSFYYLTYVPGYSEVITADNPPSDKALPTLEAQYLRV